VFEAHTRRVKKLQVEAGNPHLLLSAGEDGCVRQLDLRQPPPAPPPRRATLRADAAAALQTPDVLLAVRGGRVEINRRVVFTACLCDASCAWLRAHTTLAMQHFAGAAAARAARGGRL
jgi:hypothetical protein